jgi:hypothetical protein
MNDHPSLLKYLLRLIKTDLVKLEDKVKIIEQVLNLQTSDQKKVIDFLFSSALQLKRIVKLKHFNTPLEDESDEEILVD